MPGGARNIRRKTRPKRWILFRCSSAAGEHTERNLILDLALALAEDRRSDIVRKTRNGLESAACSGRKGDRPRVVDADKRRAQGGQSRLV